MLWPLLVEYTEPGIPLPSAFQQQGNMALFLTLFIVTCVEVLIVKVAQSERELEMILTPHDPPYLSEYADDLYDEEDDEDDYCRVRATLYEEELRRQTNFLLGNSYLIAPRPSNCSDSKKEENGYANIPCESELQENVEKSFQRNADAVPEGKESETKKTENQSTVSSDTVQVREFIEKLVETIIGGSLDGITVGKLSTHSAYENAFDYNFPKSRHSSLRRLIKRIVSEATALPNIKEILCRPKATKVDVNDDFNDKSYEDILATAILNKVIESFQKKKNRGKKTGDGRKKSRGSCEKLKHSDDDEDLLSLSDWSDTSRSDQLSLTIEEHIEEVTTAFEVSDDERSDYSEYETSLSHRVPFPESGRTVRDGIDDDRSEEDDQCSATELVTSTNSWEENWLFQKKRLRSTPSVHHPVPVPMLVPNPSEDYRALVGGVDADDLSDMSDCSDSVLEDLITTDGVPPEKLHEPKYNYEHHKIVNKEEEKGSEAAPKSTENGYEGLKKEEDSKIADMLPKTESIVGVVEEDCRVEKVAKDSKSSSQSSTSPETLSQKDREFSVEDFDWLQRCDSGISEKSFQGTTPAGSSDCADESLRCRIAEREKKKWSNPVPLPDNPYSLENIEKREQKKKNEFFRIGTYTQDYIDFPDDLSPDEFEIPKRDVRVSRDYYVNASKHPSGMSSPSSLNQLSEGYEQESFTAESKKSNEGDRKECTYKMQDKIEDSEPPRRRIASKYDITLPNVKELAKQFGADERKEQGPPKAHPDAGTKAESKHDHSISDQREPELDYSAIPVSEIILNLKNSFQQSPRKENRSLELFHRTEPACHMEITRTVSNILNVQNQTEKSGNGMDGVRFNGKQVHSLTARSISKEFREGLKNNCCQRMMTRVERGSSGGESDAGDVPCKEERTSPTPWVDLRDMKMFWEGIITANSIKQK